MSEVEEGRVFADSTNDADRFQLRDPAASDPVLQGEPDGTTDFRTTS